MYLCTLYIYTYLTILFALDFGRILYPVDISRFLTDFIVVKKVCTKQKKLIALHQIRTCYFRPTYHTIVYNYIIMILIIKI
jgi:hypothetical protein